MTESGEPHDLWEVPAEEDDYKNAAQFLLSAVEPEASAGRAGFVARLLATRDYTKAEVALVMKELPFDPEASHNYGNGLNLADIQRIVDENRELRARLKQKMTSQQRDDLIARCPEQIDPDAFHCVDFTERNEPLWKYAPHLGSYDRTPNSELESLPPKRSREEASGPVDLLSAMPDDMGWREKLDHLEGAEQNAREDTVDVSEPEQ